MLLRSSLALGSAWLGVLLTAPICSGAAAAPAPKVDELLNQAQASVLKGKPQQGLALADQAVDADPKNPQCYYVRGRIYDAIRQPEKALADFDHVLKLEPRAVEVYQLRGAVQFKLGRFTESISDFDKFIEKVPKYASQHWQRGISLYYAGRYQDGRRQFELHQTVNSNDVENAVWHFLCVARIDGVEKARASLIPIKEDKRVPMMQIYALFAGRGPVEEVFAATREGNPPAAELNQRLFYAHLYLGLYYDVTGDGKRARDHIEKATDAYAVDHYMGDVARVQATLLTRRAKAGAGRAGDK
jgi:lipoprotein NlpI